MIVTEIIEFNGKKFNRTYSSLGYYITCNGLKYVEAVDLTDSNNGYIETDELIPVYEEYATEEDYLEALAKLGVE